MHACINNSRGMQIEMERKMSCIPNDIVVEILLGLPAKSLLRLRWTCKYWFDLITRDHEFIKMHLHYSTTHDDGILSIISYRGGDGHRFFQSSLDYSDTTRVGDVSSEVCFPLPSDYPQKKYHLQVYHMLLVLGSCNGLILFYQTMSGKLCIWNPCTKEYKILPHPPYKIEGFSCQSFRRHCGFSYNHTTNDYKVIIITCHFVSYDNLDLHDDIQVYTLGTNSWRRNVVDKPQAQRLLSYQLKGVGLDGVIYWTDGQHGNIISFDIGKGNFQHVPKIPNYSSCWSDGKMRVFEGSKCAVIRNPDHGGADMWVMNNNNNSNSNDESLSSWTKLLTIPDQDQCLLPIMPHRFTRNGHILMVTRENYIRLYDPKNNNVKTLCQYPNRYLIIDVYTESLVSLNSGTYIGQDRRKEQQEEEVPEAKRKKKT